MNANEAKKKYKSSITFEIVGMIAVCIILFATIYSYVSFQIYNGIIKSQMETLIENTCFIARDCVNGDFFDEYLESNGESESSQLALSLMQRVCNDTKFNYLYLIRPDFENGKVLNSLSVHGDMYDNLETYDVGVVTDITAEDYDIAYRQIMDGEKDIAFVYRLDMPYTNRYNEEILPHTDKLFPHSSYYVEPDKFPNKSIPWHWHEDLEIMYVVRGEMEIKTVNKTYILSEGSSAFINTNVLHYQRPLGSAKVITLNQVFHASIIYGNINSVFYTKYVMPILACKELDIMIFGQEMAIDRKITQYIKLSQDLSDDKKAGYEIEVRNALSSMLLLIYEKASEIIKSKKITSSQGEERLKIMMEYLHNNYMNKVSLLDIAYEANISEREAIRTFNNILNISPFAYLMQYRIRMATVLLSETNYSISQIAYDCGFGSTSYFGKEFKKMTGMTAVEYRKQHN